MTRIAIALAALVAAATDAGAHARSVSYSAWTLDGVDATVRVRIAQLDASALAAGSGIGPNLQNQLRLFAGGEFCPPERASFRELDAEPGWVVREWTVRCAASAGPWRVRSDLLVDVVPGHVHFARVGTADRALVLNETVRDGAVSADGGGPGQYVTLGIEHIASGRDHLVFLLALVLLGGALRRVAAVVTGFTIGHSVTLALAVLGWATPDGRTVEALIGLSIVLIAVENVWLAEGRRQVVLPVVAVVGTIALAVVAATSDGGASPLALCGVALFAACYFSLLARAARPERLRWGVASLFGLVHGFGFAGVLRGTALPADGVVGALLGFNAGVEVGQLMVLALLWPVVALLSHRGAGARLALVQSGSTFATCAGCYWVVSRILS